MIIKFPTALYRSVLPTGSEVGNITYTISTTAPPISNESFLQLPRDQELRTSPLKMFNKQQKRQFLGDLIFDVMVTAKSKEGSGSKQFEIGQVMDFTDTAETSADPYALDSMELRQDTAVVNFERYGLAKSEMAALVQEAQLKMDELTASITQTGTLINANDDQIRLNQADINQATKLYTNITTVFGEMHSSALKVKAKIDAYEVQKQELLNARAAMQVQLDTLRTQLEMVREVVR